MPTTSMPSTARAAKASRRALIVKSLSFITTPRHERKLQRAGAVVRSQTAACRPGVITAVVTDQGSCREPSPLSPARQASGGVRDATASRIAASKASRHALRRPPGPAHGLPPRPTATAMPLLPNTTASSKRVVGQPAQAVGIAVQHQRIGPGAGRQAPGRESRPRGHRHATAASNSRAALDGCTPGSGRRCCAAGAARRWPYSSQRSSSTQPRVTWLSEPTVSGTPA